MALRAALSHQKHPRLQFRRIAVKGVTMLETPLNAESLRKLILPTLSPQRTCFSGFQPIRAAHRQFLNFSPRGIPRQVDAVQRSIAGILVQNAVSMRVKRSSAQLAFAWFDVPQSPHKRTRSRIQKLQWPPRIGQKLAFRSTLGIETGILRQIKWGLVWREYVLRDGKIVAEGDLILRPEDTPWRDPRSVDQAEVTSCVERVKAFHTRYPDADPTQVPHVWADICQLMAHFTLKSRIARERRENALMEIRPSVAIN
jgi:hypothetical protein